MLNEKKKVSFWLLALWLLCFGWGLAFITGALIGLSKSILLAIVLFLLGIASILPPSLFEKIVDKIKISHIALRIIIIVIGIILVNIFIHMFE